jgi:hypothetical protein
MCYGTFVNLRVCVDSPQAHARPDEAALIPERRSRRRFLVPGSSGLVRLAGVRAQLLDSGLEQIIDAADRVVFLFRIKTVGAGSGVPVERGDAMVWTFRAGRLVRLDYFNSQEQALAAAGLQK